MAELKVRKRDGRLQDFSREKIAVSVAKAGGTREQAGKIAVEVENWASNISPDGVVTSLQIREKTLELLRPVDPEAAESFEEYHKEKEVAA